ncbi:family 20 glycosylhydrolase [Rhodanobacter sp. DHB23]|uniref:family 20 glycosylhydrolase n=1 Tax=Rhodanobacter sp. DHB23 TaxID=2775923 RepID=UPI001780C13B|nr:family 20 glycosylhydrolase [Rhodanobacter sp. DHB23]MBD8871915.1 family 20 glycosylhydrolase [Rhodanobacter sp. DHB23]
MSRVAPSRLFRCMAVAWLATAGGAAAASDTPAWSLMPQPASMQPAASGSFDVADGAEVVVYGAGLQSIADRFVQRVADTGGLHLRMATAASAHPAITFELDPHADVVGDAGYRITVGDQGIRVVSRTPRGAFYGGVTLWQLLTPPGWMRGAPAAVADGVIDDHPRFAWRALLLDSGRHFQSVADIEKLIDWMSQGKLDVLLWHVTEDQGWRLQIPEYPELTRVGACRKAVGLDAELTGSADKPYCGYYTEAEVREIVRYATERYVDVVPEIDLPGHSQAAIAAYPWLGVTGRRPAVWTDWGVSPWLLDPNEKTLRFVDDVLDEVMRLFPSKYISLGGDEADKQQWNASPEVRAQMHSLGLANMDQLQGWFMGRLADYLVRHGRRPVGWDDEIVAGATLPATQLVMSWHGDDNERVALQAARQGHDVVMTPQESLYFDHYQSSLPDEWAGPPPAATLRQAYDTAIIPPGANAAEARRIVGVQASLWTEQMPTFAHDQHALFPRLAAMSELAWSPADAHDWNGFLQRMPAELARWRALGIGYADSAFAPAFQVAAGADGAFRVTLSTQAGPGTIRYTTDGSAPGIHSTPYTQPLTLTDRTTLRAAAFAPDGFELAAPRTQVLDEATSLSRDGGALATCSGQPASRLDGSRPAQGTRPVYAVDIGNACWLWPQAQLSGIRHVALAVERIAWRFGDEARDATVRRKASAAGEFEIHAGSCTGPLLASLPLERAAPAKGQIHLDADVALPAGAGVRDLCIYATGDPRDGQWALAHVAFSK